MQFIIFHIDNAMTFTTIIITALPPHYNLIPIQAIITILIAACIYSRVEICPSSVALVLGLHRPLTVSIRGFVWAARFESTRNCCSIITRPFHLFVVVWRDDDDRN